MTTVCTTSPDLKAMMKKFRFRKDKNIAAIIMKIDREKLEVQLDEVHEDISIEDLEDELPTAEPRYLLISYVYNHDDGRVSYPLCFVYYSPSAAKSEQNMLYAGSKTELIQATGLTKTFEIRDSSELTAEWLESKLAFFR